jgi:hypothetical protein
MVGERTPLSCRIDTTWPDPDRSFDSGVGHGFSTEKYESYVDVVTEEWTNMKIEVRGDKARLYVHGRPNPSYCSMILSSVNATGRLLYGLDRDRINHLKPN